MITQPAQHVNDGIVVGDVRLPEVPGVDLAATVERVGDWGGDEGLYSLFLGAALVEAPLRDAKTVRSVGVIAGWRAGVIGLRDDALARAASSDPSVAAAALGIPAEHLAWFLAEQHGDRFAWPGNSQPIADVGGFRGFGGNWVEPPTRAFICADGVLAVLTGTDVWAVHLDVFGHRVSRIDEQLPAEQSDPSLELRLSPDSYLVQVLRARSA